MKHTPGPWMLNEPFATPKAKWLIWAGHPIASVSAARKRNAHCTDMSSEEGKANAHLIAAAPEMYEALKALAHCTTHKTLEAAYAALAKAEGRHA